ncbi:MAG TPA: VOC family protein [Candidatus Paceibacterota bacterium]|jgi:predicted enzyme related to lactoylglutathione lyase|nr:VOC family protein [Candidatus Paceibacterota bacterium]
MDPVVHFEMPFDDRDRMVGFYAKAFGWQANLLGEDMGNYAVMMTGEDDPATRRPKEPGRINGGFFKRNPKNAYPSVTIAVKDIKAAMKKVEEAGGHAIGGHFENGEPDMIPGVGLYASCIDTEGNRISLLQPMGM